MTFIEPKRVVKTVGCSTLLSDDARALRAMTYLIRRIDKLSVPLVALTLLGIDAAISACTEALPFYFLRVLDDVLVQCIVLSDVLIGGKTKKTNLRPTICL